MRAMTETTGRDALERLCALAALYQEQRDLMAGAAPDLDRVGELAGRIDAAVAALPAPDRLIEVDDACLEALQRESQTLGELHRQTAAALADLLARHAAQRPVGNAHARAYSQADTEAESTTTAPRFLDQRR